PHSFRHTHTSLLIEAGVGVKEIQQRLGHTDINTTMNIYAHMTANMEEKASHHAAHAAHAAHVRHAHAASACRFWFVSNNSFCS
ncbi:tyrosine-type recombinase/integrase, partial [Peribacillus frigoritolerans]|uniref:tyrosine-type recombinase/integrase n=1 Tax=Peribacillus frigoritolerans TaxID=450367 RepID=UPI003399051B